MSRTALVDDDGQSIALTPKAEDVVFKESGANEFMSALIRSYTYTLGDSPYDLEDALLTIRDRVRATALIAITPENAERQPRGLYNEDRTVREDLSDNDICLPKTSAFKQGLAELLERVKKVTQEFAIKGLPYAGRSGAGAGRG